MDRQIGEITKISDNKDFGFIRHRDQSYFTHISHSPQIRIANKGDNAEFSLEWDQRRQRHQARIIDLLQAPPDTISPIVEINGIQVKGGLVWEEWVQECDLKGIKCLAMLDQNNVVNALSFNEAKLVGVALDHLNFDSRRIPTILCSYGKDHSHKAFDECDFCPVINELWGFVFTDVRSHVGENVEVYPFRDLPDRFSGKAIRITGDKSHVSRLMGIPTILFDDNEDHILCHAKGHPNNMGIVVPWHIKGNKRICKRRTKPGYRYEANPERWSAIIHRFGSDNGACDPFKYCILDKLIQRENNPFPILTTIQENLEYYTTIPS